DELSQDTGMRNPWVKILTELRKCWRRVCAQFWDVSDFDVSAGPEVPISPGGIAGPRDSSLDTSSWSRADPDPPQLEEIFLPRPNRVEASFSADGLRHGNIDFVINNNRPATPENVPVEDVDRIQASPGSITSVDVISCSFPAKNMRSVQPG